MTETLWALVPIIFLLLVFGDEVAAIVRAFRGKK
jgi:hypothetical protein